MKKFLALLLTFALILALAACGSSEEISEEEEASLEYDTDSEYILAKGTLVVGITEFKPMDYKDENNEWVGFDADLTNAFAEELGVNVEFREIDWDHRVLALANYEIDCVWNGLTLTDEIRESMGCSNAYCTNSQAIVMNEFSWDRYDSVDSMKGVIFAVESGSAGEKTAIENSLAYVPFDDQKEALAEVDSGTFDAAIIDQVMADAMVGTGNDYEYLASGITLSDEEYGVGFRLESDLTEKLNQFLRDKYEEGYIQELAETYGLENNIIEQ